MSDINVSPNMNLPVPITGQEPGPDWANDYNSCMSVIDAHTHAPGSGVQITPSGINISSDLTFNNTHNATNLRSVRLYPNGSNLALGTDLGCLYESGVDLYYNDGAGNQIRITQSGSVAGSTGTITGLPSGTASAAYNSGSGTFVFQQATSTGANLDVASIAIRYPGSYPTPAGNYIQLQAPSSLASGYSLTLPALPAANNSFLTASTAGVISSSLTVDNSTLAISGSNIVVKTAGLTGTQMSSNINLPGKSVEAGGSFVVLANTNPAQNSLCILRGEINTSGAKTNGEGFTCSRGSTGFYEVNITTPFGDTPVVIVTPSRAVGDPITISSCQNIASDSFTIYTTNTSGTAADCKVEFIAIGQRS